MDKITKTFNNGKVVIELDRWGGLKIIAEDKTFVVPIETPEFIGSLQTMYLEWLTTLATNNQEEIFDMNDCISERRC